MIKSLSFGAAALLCLFGSIYIGSRDRNTPPSHIAIEPSSIDYGEIGKTKECETPFEVTNQMSYDIHIDRILKSCQCSSVDILARVIPAGGKTTGLIKWSPNGKGGKTTSSITFISHAVDNEHNTSFKTIKIDAMVDSNVNVSSSKLTFSRSSKSTVLSIFVSFPKSSTEHVIDALSDSTAISTRLRPRTEHVDHLEISFDPKLFPPNKSAAKITIRTTDKDEPFLTIPITVTN